MPDEDYYRTLGVDRSAQPEEIQKAYRKLAREYHPDLHPDDKDAKRKFQSVQRAFDVLNDPKKRKMYDQYGAGFEDVQQGGGPGSGGSRVWTSTGNAEDFDFGQAFGQSFSFGDLFGQMGRGAGPRTRRRAPTRGADVQAELEISFQTSVEGGETSFGIVRGGATETISVQIPPGIEDGKTMRLRGQGEPSPTGGSPGDLLVKVRVAAHPFFERRGNNLHLQLPVSLAEAVLGSKVDVPTPSGTVTLSIPPGSSSGAKLRIRGHGIQPKGKPAGDLLAELQVVLPQELDDEAREAVRRFDSVTSVEPRRELRW